MYELVGFRKKNGSARQLKKVGEKGAYLLG